MKCSTANSTRAKFALILSACIAAVVSRPVAQTVPFHLLPAKLDALLAFDGPERAMQRLQGTNLATMLESQEAAEIWARALRMLEQDESAPEGLRTLIRAIGDDLSSYAGRVSVGFGFEVVDSEPQFELTVAFGPDGETDLAAVAAACVKAFADDNPDAVIVEMALADGTQAEVCTDDDGYFLLPRIVDEHLLLGRGSAESYVGEIARQRDSADRDDATSKRLADAVLGLQMTESLWSKLRTTITELSDPEEQAQIAMMAPLFDMIETVDLAEMTLRPQDEFIVVDYTIDSDPARANLSDMLDPKTRIPLIDLAPRNLPSVSTMSFSIPRVLQIAEQLADASGASLDDLEDMATETLGIRLRAELLDRLEGTMLMVEQIDPDDDESATVGLALAIKDSAGLTKSVDDALRKRGMHAGKKTEAYRGHDVSTMTFLGMFPLAWSITDSEWILGFGADGSGVVRAILDAVEDRRAGTEPAAWSPVVAARVSQLQADWRWLSVADGSMYSEAWLDSVQNQIETVDDMGDLSEEGLDLLLDAARLMVRFELLVSVTGTSFEQGRMLMRTIW